jgi:transcriptional regulator with XRE-family HTH domain
MEELSLFNELKEIRIKKNLKLQDIANRSRVQLKYLESIEAGDILEIPEVYDKLFFKAYLKAVEVDEEEYYETFLRYRQNIREDKTTTVFDFEKKTKFDRQTISKKNILLILPIIAVLIIIWILISNTEIVDTTTSEDVKEININDIVKTIQKQEQAKKDTVFKEQLMQQGIILKINGLKRTWFRVIADKQDTSEFLLSKGQFVNLEAQNYFEFLIGRADGLKFELNGQLLEPLGTDSAVVTYMLIDTSGIVAKRLKTPIIVSEIDEQGR